MKVSTLIDCSTTLIAVPSGRVVARLNASAYFPDDGPSNPSFSLPDSNTPLVHACNALVVSSGLEHKDIPTELTTRQLYGWLVCLAISRAFEIKIGLTIEVPTGPDPRD
jgi:hypothetical protein